MKNRTLKIIIIFVITLYITCIPVIADIGVSEPTDNGKNGIYYKVLNNGHQIGSIIYLNGIFRAYIISKGQIGDNYSTLLMALEAIKSFFRN